MRLSIEISLELGNTLRVIADNPEASERYRASWAKRALDLHEELVDSLELYHSLAVSDGDHDKAVRADMDDPRMWED